MFDQLTNNYTFLKIEVLGNSIYNLVFACLIFLLVLIALKIFKTIIIAKLKSVAEKTENEFDDVVVGAMHSIHWPFYILVSFYFSLHFIIVQAVFKKWVFYIFIIVFIYYVIRFFEKLIDYSVNLVIKKRKEKEEDFGIVKLLGLAIKIIAWAVAVILILSNMGYNVTSLIAGLGIGGLAIAFALQNILGDLFSSLAIYFDKPFKPGDFIVMGDYMGIVKKIGLKTTRIQALQGEEIVVPNNELTNAKVQNFGKMEKRRIVFSIGVAYDTPVNKLKEIPSIIKEIINKANLAEVDRIHFKSFGDFSLIYEIVFFVSSGEYNVYMDIQQKINIAIIEKFEKEKINIAFPTQTIHLKK